MARYRILSKNSYNLQQYFTMTYYFCCALVCMSKNKLKHITKLKILYPPEDFWGQRTGYANSSSMHHIIKENWGTLIAKENQGNFFNKSIKHGNQYEKVALKFISMKYKSEIHNVGSIRHPKYEYIRATPDGLAIIKDKITSIEVKCPVAPYRITAKIPEYHCQYHTAAQCAQSEQILFARFQFIEEQGKWSVKQQGFEPGKWKEDCVAFGYWTGFWKTDFRLFVGDDQPANIPKTAVLFQLKRLNEEWFEPVDLLTENLTQIKNYVEWARLRHPPNEHQLIDIKQYLIQFHDIKNLSKSDPYYSEKVDKILTELMKDIRLDFKE